MKLVGLTGGIACGKSMVSEIIRKEFKLKLIDCDLIAHDTSKKVIL